MQVGLLWYRLDELLRICQETRVLAFCPETSLLVWQEVVKVTTSSEDWLQPLKGINFLPLAQALVRCSSSHPMTRGMRARHDTVTACQPTSRVICTALGGGHSGSGQQALMRPDASVQPNTTLVWWIFQTVVDAPHAA